MRRSLHMRMYLAAVAPPKPPPTTTTRATGFSEPGVVAQPESETGEAGTRGRGSGELHEIPA